MPTESELKTQVAKTEVHPLRDLLSKVVKDLDNKRAEKFNRIAYSFVRANPQITACEPQSLAGAFLLATQLDLEPVAGQSYILPFNQSEKKADGTWHSVKRAQFVLGYRGLANLFYRHEKSTQLSWGIVKEHDMFEFELGTNPFLKHRPQEPNPPVERKVLGYYVVAKLANGGTPFLYMTEEECLEHGRKHSKTYDKKKEDFFDNSPWKTNKEAMCLKTVLIQLGKLLPISVQVQAAIQADETSRDWSAGVANALELPSTTSWEDPKLPAPEKGDAQE